MSQRVLDASTGSTSQIIATSGTPSNHAIGDYGHAGQQIGGLACLPNLVAEPIIPRQALEQRLDPAHDPQVQQIGR